MTILIVTAIGTIVGTIVALEARAWMPHLSRRLLRETVDRLAGELPAGLALRWSEEMEADFATYESRPLGGIVFAVGLRLRGGRNLPAQLAPELDGDSDPIPPEVDSAIPVLPVAASVSQPATAAADPADPLRSSRLQWLIEHPRAPIVVSAVGLSLSICAVVVTEILEERERG